MIIVYCLMGKTHFLCMKNFIYLTCFLVFFVADISAQGNYYLLNDSLFVGRKMMTGIGKDKFHSVTVEANKKTLRYTPDSISEFRADGITYDSRIFPSGEERKKVFMERIISADSTFIYYYADHNGSYYFLKEKGSNELRQITEENKLFEDFLYQKYGDCPTYNRLKEYKIKPSSNSMRYANKMYSTCNPNYITRFRFGVMAGAGISFMSPEEFSKSESDFTYYVGLFADIPVSQGFSFHPEAYYMKDAIVSSDYKDNSYIDITYNKETVAIPLLARYSFLFVKGRTVPYMQIGPLVNIGLKKEIEQRTISYEEEVHTVFNELGKKNGYLYMGVSCGTGLEYKLTGRHSVFADFRYNYVNDNGSNHQVFFNLSFNF